MADVNIFVLNAGRCGSNTFAVACSHAANLSVGHESRVEKFGEGRLAYPSNHIEVDNRLSWFLGSLGARFPTARYVHLRRNREDNARSYAQRWPQEGVVASGTFVPDRTIIRQFGHVVVFRERAYTKDEIADLARFYVDTVNSNISEFLRHRAHVVVELEHIETDFPAFWRWAGLAGDCDAAQREWDVRYNAASGPGSGLLAPEFAAARAQAGGAEFRGTPGVLDGS